MGLDEEEENDEEGEGDEAEDFGDDGVMGCDEVFTLSRKPALAGRVGALVVVHAEIPLSAVVRHTVLIAGAEFEGGEVIHLRRVR